MVTRKDYTAEKVEDAWDLYYCLKHYPGGLDAMVEQFRPYIHHGLVKEGLEKIAKHFESEKHTGPTFVADFEGEIDNESRELLQRDAFERINYILGKLGIK